MDELTLGDKIVFIGVNIPENAMYRLLQFIPRQLQTQLHSQAEFLKAVKSGTEVTH